MLPAKVLLAFFVQLANNVRKSHLSRSPWLGAILLFGYISPVSALTLEILSSKTHVTQNEVFTVTYLVSNPGNTTRTNVVLTGGTLPLYTQLNDGASLPVVTNCGISCLEGEIPIWSLGTIEAGNFKTVVATYFITASGVDGNTPELSATVSHSDDGSADTASTSVTIDSSPQIDLALSSSQQIINQGEAITYEVAYGNIGSQGMVAPQVKAIVPAGTTFISASDGGTLSGNEVTWDIGILNVDQAGKRYFSVQTDVNDSIGSIYKATASLENSGNTLNQASDMSIIDDQNGLDLHVAINNDRVHTSEYIEHRYIISNSGNIAKTDVTLNIKADSHLRFSDGGSLPAATGCGLTCGDSVEDWGGVTIGTLAAGESRVIPIQFYRSSAVDAEILTTQAFLSDSSNQFQQAITTAAISQEQTQLDLLLAASKYAVSANEVFEYDLSFANVRNSSYQNVQVELQLPENVTFVSASDGGSHNAGIIVWSVGTLSPEENAKVQVVVQANNSLSNGNIISAFAFMSEGSEQLIRSEEVTVIHSTQDLNLHVSLDGDSFQTGNYVNYRYLVTNTSMLSQSNVTLHIKADSHLRFSDGGSLPTAIGCSLTCGDSSEDWATFSIGTLTAGASKVVTVQKFATSLTEGEVFRSHAFLSADTLPYTQGQTLSILDADGPTIELVLTASKQSIEAGQTFEFEISYGNTDNVSYQDTELEIELPANATVSSVSDDGIQANGTVKWALGTLSPGQSGKRSVTLIAANNLSNGQVLTGRSKIHTGDLSLARASDSAVINSNQELLLDVVTASDLSLPGNYVYQKIVVSNQSQITQADVTIYVKADFNLRFQDGGSLPSNSGCSLTCGDSNEDWATYSLGNIAANESRVIWIEMYRSSVSEGEVLRTHTFLQSTSLEHQPGRITSVLAQDDDNLIDFTVTASKHVLKQGEFFDLRLNFANATNESYADVILELQLPEGLTLISAPDQAVTNENRLVTWDIGTVSAGGVGSRGLTVMASQTANNADSMRFEAKFKRGDETIIHAEEVLGIHGDNELTVSASYQGTTTEDYEYYHFTVSNDGLTDKADVVLYLKSDFGFRFSDGSTLPLTTGCSVTCADSNEDWAFYNLGSLEAGESRTVPVVTYLSGIENGEVLALRAMVESSSVLFQQGLIVNQLYNDDTKPQVTLSSDNHVIASNDNQAFRIVVGNSANSAAEDLLLTFTIPEDFSFVSATGDFIRLGNKVYWPLGNMLANSYFEQSINLRASAAMDAGETRTAKVELSDSSFARLVSDAQIVTVVDTAPTPSISLSSGTATLDGTNLSLTRTIDITNAATTEILDVDAYYFEGIDFTFRGGDAVPSTNTCSTCGDSIEEWVLWDLGNIDIGQSNEITLTSSARTTNILGGELNISQAVLKHTTANRHDHTAFEIYPYGPVFSPDTSHDSDGDSIPDWWEIFFGLNRLDSSDASLDLDGDGLTSLQEFLAGTNPNNSDSDGDGVEDDLDFAPLDPNVQDADSDGDGMGDRYEAQFGFDPNDSGDAVLDPDGDNLTNLQEHDLGTNPLIADTDEDAKNDGEEASFGTNPLVFEACPGPLCSSLMYIIIAEKQERN